MSATHVALSFKAPGAWVWLRELRGQDEALVGGCDTLTAIQLLDQLLVDKPGVAVKPGAAASLTAADRDRLLAAIYLQVYGRQIGGTLVCDRCGQRFDIGFDLPDIIARLVTPDPSTLTRQNGDVLIELADGRRFRLPTGEDELAISHRPAAEAEGELLRRCVVDGNPLDDPLATQDAMRAVAPVMKLDLQARCAACGALQTVHFDVQHYLLSALQAEQPQLAHEVHCLASAYSWGLDVILGLTRSQRRTYAALIEADRARGVA